MMMCQPLRLQGALYRLTCREHCLLGPLTCGWSSTSSRTSSSPSTASSVGPMPSSQPLKGSSLVRTAWCPALPALVATRRLLQHATQPHTVKTPRIKQQLMALPVIKALAARPRKALESGGGPIGTGGEGGEGGDNCGGAGGGIVDGWSGGEGDGKGGGGATISGVGGSGGGAGEGSGEGVGCLGGSGALGAG